MPFQTSSQFGEGNEDIDLGDIGRTLRRKWRIIVLITLATTLIGFYLVLKAQPQFTLNGSIYFGDSQTEQPPQDNSGINLLSSFQTYNDVPTEVQLLQSTALVEQAILETGLNVYVKPQDSKPLAYWEWRFKYGKAIQAFAPKPSDLTVLYATIYDPGSNYAEFTLIFGDNGAYLIKTDNGRTVITGTLNQPASGGGITLLIKSSIDGPAPAAGSTYDLGITPAKALADDLIGGALSVDAEGSSTSPTQVADINLLWNDPYQGQIFVNQLMKDFIATQLAWKTQSASNTEDFVKTQLAKIQSSLADADSKLAAYQSQTGIVDVPTNAQAVINQLSQYQVQRSTALLQQQALEQLVKATSKKYIKTLNPYLVTQADDPVLTQLAGNLATAQIQMQSQTSQFTAKAPQTVIQQATIDKTESAIGDLLVNDEALAKRNLANLDSIIAGYEDQLKAMPAESLKVIALTRSSNTLGQLYVLLMQNEETAEVSKAATIVNTRIVSPAEIPLYATSPKATVPVVAGAVLGLLAGITLVLAQRVLSGRYHSENEIRRSISLPIYGLIPKRSKAEKATGIFPSREQNAFAESFRLLRSKLYQLFENPEAASKVILITSAAAGDGKTTIASNLAKSISDDGKRVLIIDGDLHRGHLHEALNLAQAPGLSEWLLTKKPSATLPVEQQGFKALTAGAFPPHPSELLNDAGLGNIINILRGKFDFLIIDCPPLPSVADTLTWAKYADIILSIACINRTPRVLFRSHNDIFGETNLLRGVVINSSQDGHHAHPLAYGETNSSWRDRLETIWYGKLEPLWRDLLKRAGGWRR